MTTPARIGMHVLRIAALNRRASLWGGTTPNEPYPEDMNEEPKTFQITTLSDIFNLPTIEQMKKCLSELSEAMIQARMVNEALVEQMRAAGHECIHKAIEWPESAKWTDDEKREITIRVGHEGKEQFRVTTTMEES